MAFDMRTFLRGPLGPKHTVPPPAMFTSDAHGNVWHGNLAVSGPAASGYATPGQGSTGGHPSSFTLPQGTFQHQPRMSIGP